MNKEPSEVDQIIHYMRQSKMDAVRKGLEKLVKLKNGKNNTLAMIAHAELRGIFVLFKEASNDAPWS